MDFITRESALFIFDTFLRLVGIAAIAYLLRNVYVSARRGHVYIYGKVAKRTEEPFGYWFVMSCWVAVCVILAHAVVRGL
jgi:hypothetical protein